MSATSICAESAYSWNNEELEAVRTGTVKLYELFIMGWQHLAENSNGVDQERT